MTVLTLTNCLHYSHYDQQLTCCCTQKVGQQVQYLIILTKIKYTARLSNMKFCHFLSQRLPCSNCKAVQNGERSTDTYTVMCGPGLMLCCVQASFPHYLNPSDRKLSSQNPFLEPSSKPAQVDMKGTLTLFCIVKIILSTTHLMLALMLILIKHAGYYWHVCINVFINVEMKSMISVVAPSPPLHTANSLSSLQEDLDYRKWCPSVLVHTYTGHDWFRLNLNSTGKENIDRLSPNINRHVELYIYTLSLHIQYIPHQSCTYLHVYYTLSHP